MIRMRMTILTPRTSMQAELGGGMGVRMRARIGARAGVRMEMVAAGAELAKVNLRRPESD
jgi:hypothetical protein